jgi:hypothetical protein
MLSVQPLGKLTLSDALRDRLYNQLSKLAIVLICFDLHWLSPSAERTMNMKSSYQQFWKALR